MTEDDLKTAVRRQPFEPFRLKLTAGEAFDIRHPKLIMVGRRAAVIGLTDDPSSLSFDRTHKVDLFHVVGIEELSKPPKGMNGPPA
ncbi:MAG TPA: hypothetical protein VH120_07145 [Gemmataceae bacterium]|jgi:hypothetical protein|nr:hypothetical protein [Gemmataceae bacterium]